jgi:hypothetical protein
LADFIYRLRRETQKPDAALETMAAPIDGALMAKWIVSFIEARLADHAGVRA